MPIISTLDYVPGDSEETVIKKLAQSCGLPSNGTSFQSLVSILVAVRQINNSAGQNVIFTTTDGTVGTQS